MGGSSRVLCGQIIADQLISSITNKGSSAGSHDGHDEDDEDGITGSQCDLRHFLSCKIIEPTSAKSWIIDPEDGLEPVFGKFT